MSSAQVLKETEKATGGVEMYEQHMKLVQLKKEEKTSKTVRIIKKKEKQRNK